MESWAKCPYCAERVKEEAIFCCHCGHDLSVFKMAAIIEKIALLEKQYSEISTALEALHSKESTSAVTSHSGAPDDFRFWQRALVVVLPASVMILAQSLDNMYGQGPSGAFVIGNLVDALTLVLFLVAPLSVGVWVAIKQHGRHPIGYIFLGLLIGIVVWSALLLSNLGHFVGAYRAIEVGPENLALLVQYFLRLLALYVTLAIMLFLAGVLFGKVIRRRRSPTTVPASSIDKKIATTVAHPESKVFERVLKLSEVFWPSTLTFIGTLITSEVFFGG